jgi:uncharacterized protein YjeT (DUF2065 family)
MWNDIGAAVALLLVFEGIMPFTNPAKWRQVVQMVSTQSDTVLRTMGLASMLMGAFLLYFIR